MDRGTEDGGVPTLLPSRSSTTSDQRRRLETGAPKRPPSFEFAQMEQRIAQTAQESLTSAFLSLSLSHTSPTPFQHPCEARGARLITTRAEAGIKETFELREAVSHRGFRAVCSGSLTLLRMEKERGAGNLRGLGGGAANVDFYFSLPRGERSGPLPTKTSARLVWSQAHKTMRVP